MKRISVVALSALVISVLACGGGDDDENTPVSDDAATTPDDGGDAITVDVPTVPLTQPWTGMNLPINNGQVVVSDSSMMLVGYNNGNIGTLTSDYSAALVADGYTKGDDYSTADFTAVVYNKGSQQMGLAVGEDSGITFAYMEDLTKVDPSESTITAARNGQRGMGRARRHHTTSRSSSRKGSGAKTPSKRTSSGSSSGSKGGKKRGGGKHR